MFPSSLRVKGVEEARERIERQGDRLGLKPDDRERMLKVAGNLALADPDAGITTDELMNECGCSLVQLRAVFSALEAVGVASNDMRITVYVHVGVENASEPRLGPLPGNWKRA